jgi:hypothetical protein
VNTVRFDRVAGENGRPELLPVVDGTLPADRVERYEADRRFDVVGGYGPVWLDPARRAAELAAPGR